jgi:probable phosphoglycerate mutase
MAIYLIRHGETALNHARVVQMPETPLSQRGIAQAHLLGRRLAKAGIAHILVSDMARARMTAEPLEASTRASLAVDPELAERHFGDHRGTPYRELAEQGLDIFAPDHAPPNGETWEVFHRRVERAWAKACAVAAELDGHLAVVTHGLVCHSIAARLAELPESFAPRGSYAENGPPLRFGNTAVSILREPRLGEGAWRFELFACTEHLAGAAQDGGTPGTPA